MDSLATRQPNTQLAGRGPPFTESIRAPPMVLQLSAK